MQMSSTGSTGPLDGLPIDFSSHSTPEGTGGPRWKWGEWECEGKMRSRYIVRYATLKILPQMFERRTLDIDRESGEDKPGVT